MQKNPEVNEQVYSFFGDTVIVTKSGNIATAMFEGCPVTNFKNGNALVATSFVDNYPELRPKKSALACGLLWKVQADNYIATIEILTSGKAAISYKNTISGRTNALTYDDYVVYGTISWITN